MVLSPHIKVSRSEHPKFAYSRHTARPLPLIDHKERT